VNRLTPEEIKEKVSWFFSTIHRRGNNSVWFRERGLTHEVTVTKSQFKALLREATECPLCTIPFDRVATDQITIDHIKEIREGGHSTPDNLRVVCGGCNRKRDRKHFNMEKRRIGIMAQLAAEKRRAERANASI
jgi:5-methylcytosine-specific restriction endonuclease McrA